MRPAGKGALESLYFDYPQFAGSEVARQGSHAARGSVLLPASTRPLDAADIGLLAAAGLARVSVVGTGDPAPPRGVEPPPGAAREGAPRQGRARSASIPRARPPPT